MNGVAEVPLTEIAAQAEGWPVLLPEQKLKADTVHVFRAELADLGPVKFVRLNIFPDGGMARLRLHGRPDEAGAAALRSRFETRRD